MFEKITKVIDTPHDYATIWLKLPLSLWQKYPWLIQVTYWTLEVLWSDNLSVLLFFFTLLNKILYLHHKPRYDLPYCQYYFSLIFWYFNAPLNYLIKVVLDESNSNISNNIWVNVIEVWH
jgi:hypothetical protein